MKTTNLRLLSLLLFFVAFAAQASEKISLSGEGWTFRTAAEDKARDVTVPHCWTADAPYANYIGKSIYEREFEAPANFDQQSVRLHFEAVFYACNVKLNGEELTAHEGGYTPFEVEISQGLKAGKNKLTVEVDNTLSAKTIPLAPCPWGIYGGITRDVFLISAPKIYIRKFRIDSVVDLEKKEAMITAHMELFNSGDDAEGVDFSGAVAGMKYQLKSNKVPKGESWAPAWGAVLSDVHLWSLEDPFLYEATVDVGKDHYKTNFGCRKVEIKDTELLLNGKAVHAFGVNRQADDPVHGSTEVAAVLERDMKEISAANFRIMRLAPYAQAPAVLDYADAHGILLIEEAGGAGLTSDQCFDDALRAKMHKQMREMIERDWNHPSIIAWSVGTKYASGSPGGIGWTKNMMEYVRRFDHSRMLTFVSDAAKLTKEDASAMSDFVCLSATENYAKVLDDATKYWPDAPVFLAEFGTDEANIKEALEAIRARKFVIGGAFQNFAEHRSVTPSPGLFNAAREPQPILKTILELVKAAPGKEPK